MCRTEPHRQILTVSNFEVVIGNRTTLRCAQELPFRLDTAGRSGDAWTVSVRRNQSSLTDVTRIVCWFLNCGA